jgi:hypothetical protein
MGFVPLIRLKTSDAERCERETYPRVKISSALSESLILSKVTKIETGLANLSLPFS